MKKSSPEKPFCMLGMHVVPFGAVARDRVYLFHSTCHCPSLQLVRVNAPVAHCLQRRCEHVVSIDGDFTAVIEPQDNKPEGRRQQRQRPVLLLPRWWLPEHSLCVEPLEVAPLVLLHTVNIFRADEERERERWT